jgi:hypothetical protein
MEEGQELSGLLSGGLMQGKSKFYPSFALMMNFNGGGPDGGKVLWISEAGMNLLKAHADLYDILVKDHTSPRVWTD